MATNGLLTKTTVRLRDSESTWTILNKLIRDGCAKFMIITDFDFTISKSTKSNGEANCTTHGIFNSVSNGVDPGLQDQLRALREKYYPIEMDPLLSDDQKVPQMEIWWKTAHDLICSSAFKRSTMEHYVKCAEVELRDGSLDFLRCAEQTGVPIVIFSAGIGNFIEIILRQQYGHFPENVHIISNMMRFDDKDDTIVAFNPPLIHTFNKNYSVIEKEKPFFERLRGRTNVLLLGDTLGDLNMDVGVVDEGGILKIGFLNQLIEKSLPTYLAGYNVVLTDDQTFDVPLGILKSIIAEEKKT